MGAFRLPLYAFAVSMVFLSDEWKSIKSYLI
jgi:hypothetical protein